MGKKRPLTPRALLKMLWISPGRFMVKEIGQNHGYYYYLKCPLDECTSWAWRYTKSAGGARAHPQEFHFCSRLHYMEHARRLNCARRARWYRKHHNPGASPHVLKERRKPLRLPSRRLSNGKRMPRQ
jgi:hypothetical protein